jgi:hypothetical protein
MAAEPANRHEFPDLDTQGAALALPYAWISTEEYELICLDISNLQEPQLISNSFAHPGRLQIVGTSGVLLPWNERAVYGLDLTSPTEPIIGARYALSDIPGTYLFRDGLAYLGFMSGFLLVIDLQDVHAPTFLGAAVLNGPIRQVLLQAHRAIVVYEDAFEFMSMADPAQIQPVSGIIPTDPLHSRAVWRNDLLYLALESGGIQVWDVDDPVHPRLVGDAVGPSGDLFLGPNYVLAEGAVYPLHCPTPTAADPVPNRERLALDAEPNPFNPQTTIHFSLWENAYATVEIYDARGRHLRTLIRGVRPAGEQWVQWDGRDRHGTALPSGTYFVRLSYGSSAIAIKVALVR